MRRPRSEPGIYGGSYDKSYDRQASAPLGWNTVAGLNLDSEVQSFSVESGILFPRAIMRRI